MPFFLGASPKKPSALECSKSSSFAPEMKGMKFATGGDEAKVAAFGGALAESVLDDASAEERDDSGGDESDDGKPNEEDDSSEVEGAPETSFEAKYEAILQLIFGSFNPIARMSRSGAVPSVGGSCFVAGAGRRRRFVALRPRARVRCRVHAIEGSPLAAR